MPTIPAVINGVHIEFAQNAVNDVDQRVIAALYIIIRHDIAPGHTLHRIYISSAYDSHIMPSRHMQQKAIDISRFNGCHILSGYNSIPSVRAFVDNIQSKFEECPFRRENFGPSFTRKHGQHWSAGGHHDHIHLSVD
ncbi:MAG: hypothetical protein LBU76_02925 [Azoarcus sp.]|jgi:hypothetical protein|nr:hypothetical protein [Azoarcus sp.]